jgi:ATP-dependent DNA ligase
VHYSSRKLEVCSLWFGQAFNHPACVWEPKHDGFRGLAYVERGRCRLFSRTGNRFRQCGDVEAAIARAVRRQLSVIDGEIAVRGADRRSTFLATAGASSRAAGSSRSICFGVTAPTGAAGRHSSEKRG